MGLAVRHLSLIALAGAALSGCASALPAIRSAGAAYEEAFVPLENLGRVDRWRKTATPQRLLADGHPFSLIEIGRRFETGGLGLPKDRACAAWWYERAYAAPYDEPIPSATGGSLGTYRRTQNPHASVALKRLAKAGGPVERLAPGEGLSRCVDPLKASAGAP